MLALLAAALIALAVAPGASAHAVLQQTQPGNDVVLPTAPSEVVLRFSEPVDAAPDAIRVYDGAGARVDTGELIRPDDRSIATGLQSGLPDGTYTIAWRAVSADTHPVFGASVFHVGAPGANPAGIAEQVLAEGRTPGAVTVGFTAVRFFSYALLLLCAGGVATIALALGAASEAVRQRLFGAIAVVSGALALTSLAGILLQGADVAGTGLVAAARWSVVSGVVETRFGQVWLARAVLALGVMALALAVRRAPRREWAVDAALVLCVGLVASPAAAGHASTEGALSFVVDVVHVQAASVWVGGLSFVALALLWSGAARWELARTAVPRFSTMAVVSVAALLVAGIVNGYLQIRSWSGLWETTYGRLVLAKAALVIPVIALGAWNNRRSVPPLRAGTTSLVQRRRFLRTIWAELAIVVAIVAVTAVLVEEPPARAVTQPAGPSSQLAELGDLELNLVVDPAVAGANAIHLYLLTSSGRPASVAEVDVAASLASAGIGPLRYEARRLTPGHYTVSGRRSVALPGDWQVRSRRPARRVRGALDHRDGADPERERLMRLTLGCLPRRARRGRQPRRGARAYGSPRIRVRRHRGRALRARASPSRSSTAATGSSLESDGGEEVVILGYDGEPYLRFTADGVFRNTRSPATYLNEDRFANVTVPASADPEAPPEWERVSSSQTGTSGTTTGSTG